METVDARKKGVALGKRVAYSLLASRADDNFERVDATKDEFAAGVFQQAADRKMGINIAITFRRPYGVASMTVFDPGPPRKPDSAVALRDVAEVQALAARMSAVRTADQTAAALFWNSGEDNDSQNLFQLIADARKFDVLDHARMMALLEIADADVRQAYLVFKNKYRHWRPDAAITSKFAHASVRDQTWEPLIHTPGDSEYPSGGASGAGYFLAVLTYFNGDNAAKLIWKNTAINVTRTWPTAQAMTAEFANSRVWGGAHFRTSVDAGYALGKRVTEEVLATQLKPLLAK